MLLCSDGEVVEKRYPIQVKELHMTMANMASKEVERSGSGADVQIAPFARWEEPSGWEMDELEHYYADGDYMKDCFGGFIIQT